MVAAQPSGLIWELSLQSQLSCAILIHNFLLHVARCQVTQCLSARLKGGKEAAEKYRERKGIRDALSSEFLRPSSAEERNSESAPLASGIQPGIEQEGCDMLGKEHLHLTWELTPGEVGGHTSIFLSLS